MRARIKVPSQWVDDRREGSSGGEKCEIGGG